jgi:hypothetical protein
MTKKSIFIGLFIVTLPVAADRLELYSGATVVTPEIRFEGGRFITRDSSIARESVKRLVFETPAGTAESKAKTFGDVLPLLARAKQAGAQFPDAGGVILLDEGNYTLHPDGTRDYQYHFQGLVLKDKTKGWANVQLYFEDEESKIVDVRGRTIKTDGRVIPLDPTTAKIVKPSEGGVFFGKGNWLTFSLPEVEEGDIVEYSYTENEFNPWDRNVFDPSWNFQSDEPALVSRVKITVPKDQELVFKGSSMPPGQAEPKIEVAGQTRIYVWQQNDVLPLVPEPGMVPRGDAVAKIEASNQKTWDYLYDWYSKFQVPRMAITPEIIKLAEGITKGASGPDDLIARLYHWVQQNIRYISIKGAAASGVSGHPASQTLKNGYGDCTDKAILFATMLRAAGITAYPVYIGTNDESAMLNPAIPSFYGNHCIDEVHLGDKTFYLDATGSYSRYPSFWSADQGVYEVNAQTRTVELIPVPKPEENLRLYEYQIELDTAGTAVVDYQSSYTGDWEAGVRGYYQGYGEKEWPQIFANQVKDITPYSQLIDYRFENLSEIDKPFKLELKYKLFSYPQRAGAMMIFKLPEVAGRYDFPEVGLNERHYDIGYETSEEIRDRLTVGIAGLTVEYLPLPIKISCPYGSYEAAYEFVDGELRFNDDFRRGVRIIPASDYKTYKDFIDRVIDYQKERVLLKRQNATVTGEK